jgi:DNA-binding NarL/FixJ family response regulator
VALILRILIADDSQLIRRGVVRLLSNEFGGQICGEASNAGETLLKASEYASGYRPA